MNKSSNVEIVFTVSLKISSSISCLCFVSKPKKLIILFRLLLSELFCEQHQKNVMLVIFLKNQTCQGLNIAVIKQIIQTYLFQF